MKTLFVGLMLLTSMASQASGNYVCNFGTLKNINQDNVKTTLIKVAIEDYELEMTDAELDIIVKERCLEKAQLKDLRVIYAGGTAKSE